MGILRYTIPAVASIRYVTIITNWDDFLKTPRAYRDDRLKELESPDPDTGAAALSGVLNAACETHMRNVTIGKRRPVLWWNASLAKELATLGRWKMRMRNA